MRITVVGAGAMGSLMAARLAASNNEVVLFGRPSAHLTLLQERGLTLIERDGRQRMVPLAATTDAADARGSELVIVLVKAWATAEATAPLREVLTRETAVLTLQNGLGNAATLRSTLLRGGVRPSVWMGVTTQAAFRPEPGVVVHTGDGITAIGRRTIGANERLKAIAACFSLAGWQTIAVDDIHRWVWRKLAVNAAINPLTALAGVPNRVISSDAGLRAAAAALAAEVVAVANARGVAIDTAEVLAAVEEVARATGENRSSMLVDLDQNARTEIDAINGAVVAEGRRRGVKAPANQLMTALIRARERRAQLSEPAANGQVEDDGLELSGDSAAGPARSSGQMARR
ncbi:MAG: 2-dehydropantoate 2-reductase [Chloroflexota bacterium]|nr:2-dehydropantoate 2-reductase [Chloroflexota bacterium]